MKKILITGADSYIGTCFEKYVYDHYSDQLSVDTVDMLDGSWRTNDFSAYDAVFHVAGIAHADISHVTDEEKALYYAVNTDLAVETARKACEDGARQFVFMSSAIIYGNSAPYGRSKCITKDTQPSPANFYGDSKWQADKGVRELESEDFTVTVIRAPMIYGKGSKGNYPVLSKLSVKLPFFPDVKNERSMLYIENLCEFLCQVIIRRKGGIFWPQNSEYGRTSEIVRLIAEANNRKILISRIFNPIVKIASLIPGKTRTLAGKAFGNMSYDMSMSEYDFEYRVVNLKESIERTEK